ncbi:hypothetical protein B0H14DRAFT_3430412 [Mycena olivaceomarginata]|nr:hypothetical protein B0H14DRAFT_3430412 [Mycena olivaceomarginata]
MSTMKLLPPGINFNTPHQTLNSVPDVMGDEHVMAAMASSEKDIATARLSATTLLTTVYTVQVEKALELVDIPKCTEVLASALNEYYIHIIIHTGNQDTTVWQLCVSAIKAVFTNEFKVVHFKFTVRLDKEAMVKEAKVHAVEIAHADTEMTDTNRPIEEIVSEKVNVAISAFKETWENEKKKQCPAPANLNSKPKTTSSSKDASKPLKQMTLALVKKRDKPAKEKKGKARKSVDSTEAKEKSLKGKLNGKGKVKAKPAVTEMIEESSDDST